jgi:hypothetical protein
MKKLLFFASLAAAMTASFGQGAPSPLGQTASPSAESAANRAVQARHDAVKTSSERRTARRAEKMAQRRATAASSP